MTRLLAAGVSCSGAPHHRIVGWEIAANRVLNWRDVGGEGSIPVPVPSGGDVLVADPSVGVVWLSDGSAWKADLRAGSPVWRAGESLIKGDQMASRIVAAGAAGCGTFYGVTDARRVVTWLARSVGPAALLAHHPVPGTAPVVHVAIGPPAVAVLADGTRYALTGGQWIPLRSLFADSEGPVGSVRLRALRGFALGPPRGDIAVGAVFELPEPEGLELVRQGRAEVVTEPVSEGA